MTNVDDLKKRGKAFSLSDANVSYPTVSEHEAMDLVGQYFAGNLQGLEATQHNIAFVAQGRVRRCANLPNFIWKANKFSKGLSLADMINRGIAALKRTIAGYVSNRLTALNDTFVEPATRSMCK